MNYIELNEFIEKTPIMYAANRKNTRFKLCIQCSHFCTASKRNTLKTEITWNYILYLVITYNGKESEKEYIYNQFSRVESLSCVWLFATPRTAAQETSLSITKSRRLPKLMSIESVMLSNHLTLCDPLLLPPSIFPSIRVFSKESVLRIRWPKY